VITHGQRAVAQANVEAREQTGRSSAHRATTTPDGFYVLKDLLFGVYNLRIMASGFSTEVRDVQLAANPVTIPAVPVEIGVDVIHPGELVDFAACQADPADRRPDFYRLTAATESGGVGGVILSDEGRPVQNTTVTLYRKGSGRIGSQRTNASGAFQFVGLHIESEEYWLLLNAKDSLPRSNVTCSLSLDLNLSIPPSGWSRVALAIARRTRRQSPSLPPALKSAEHTVADLKWRYHPRVR
jgi:hypothetical protein